ncbi:bifunctional UDP-sugar hydrolase/5'-nucleotidase UshA [Photobacterium sp. SDRW27]|uniref:bifunctional UDP-sugar hydrolase/5'-nucleotidase UshA n=1 Tax=Photobacterium obscurum TaxID=2829490 RepID=UPI0022442C41|nr:bifunctional UDP-sugar hydrolase/5'-nucleotidase UshA [Photobacterium obscurum]MCW8328371.1 bifunctional UDP-sugar hydrolase/5'-nucleotidase UshA [Photobacterium obscurum]
MNNINKKRLLKSTISAAILAALVGCNSSDSNDAKTDPVDPVETVKFTVLHTNDNHGRFWHNKYGEYGMAARKTLINQLREKVEADGGEVLLLSGGDINTGVPASDLQDAVPDFIGMNHIEYDAMAVGNHEFDNPRDILEMQKNLAEFPMLSANIYLKDKNERLFDAYKIFDVNGLKVAVIGLTTEDTAKIGNPEYTSDLEFRDPKAEAKKVIAELEASEKPDIILATTHMGHYENGVFGSNAPGDVALANALEAGALDAIIGGHSQNPVCMEPGTTDYAEFTPGDECTPDKQNGTYIMQAHEWGKYVGRADFEVTGEEVKLTNYELIPVNLKEKNEDGERVLIGEEIKKDEDLYALLEYYQKKGEEALNGVIATGNGKLEGDRAVVRSQQTNLGTLIATAHHSKIAKASFAVMNSGGVRDSINKDGIDNYEITYNDVLLVQPFGNMVTSVTMPGANVVEYLNTVATMQVGSGAYAQFAGIDMSVDCAASQVTINTIGGQDFDESAEYTFTVPSFNAAGGDGYPKVNTTENGYVDSGFVDADVLKGFIEEKGHINAADYTPSGVVYVNSASANGCQVAAE